MATIKEIAEKAGVSTTTVSNVIHGKTKKVSPATIQKIEALIKEVGYVQKRGLRVLNNEKSQLIAVVINYHKEFKDSILGDPFYGKIIGFIRRICTETGLLPDAVFHKRHRRDFSDGGRLGCGRRDRHLLQPTQL